MSATQENRARRHTRVRRATGPLSIPEVLALPAAVDLVTAARALNIGRNRAYELVATGQFPVPVLVAGAATQRRKFRVAKVDLCKELKLPLT